MWIRRRLLNKKIGLRLHPTIGYRIVIGVIGVHGCQEVLLRLKDLPVPDIHELLVQVHSVYRFLDGI
jgi:hypothetical protein